MWQLDNPWWEYVLRSTVIYVFVFTLLRLFGKKQLGQMGSFDLVLLLIISESISSGITGGDNSLLAALIAVSTFVFLNRFVDVISYKFKPVERLLDGKAQKLIIDGKIVATVCRKECVTQDEIMSVLRQHEVASLDEVKIAYLETNGQITVIKK